MSRVEDRIEVLRKQHLAAREPALIPGLGNALTYLEDSFGPTGYLSQHLPGFICRPGQFELANHIAMALFTRRHLVAEGPTGVGKTMSYMIPATYHAVATGDRLVVATANITLQEQLFKKDLPLLVKALPWKFTYGLYKGKSNYLCLKRVEEVKAARHKSLPLYQHPSDQRQEKDLLEWAESTTTGDVSDLSFKPSVPVWGQFSMSADDCLGDRCSKYNDCFSVRARMQAVTSRVIVTNYHVLYSHMMFGGNILPEFGVAVLDEAHQAIDIARNFFGFTITEYSLKDLLRPIPVDYREKGSRQTLVDQIRGSIENFFREMKVYQSNHRYDARVRGTLPVSDYIFQALENALRFYGEWGPKMSEPEQVKAYANYQRRLVTTIVQLEEFLNAHARPEGSVCFIEENKKGNLSLCCRKIDVSDELHKGLYDKNVTTIVTSATLAVRDSFSFVLREFGLPAETQTLVAKTPFDWSTQSCLVVPDKFEQPNSPAFKQEVGKALVDIIRMANGRTLALFTSWKGLEVAFDVVKNAGLPYRLLKQGDLPTRLLIEEFKQDTHSVLFGVDSFWHGVDVPGESLSCVVIDKLPFVPKTDPIMDALDEEGNAFFSYSIPRAVIAFRQGFGRLIRSTTDKGVVVLLDTRVHEKWKTYGHLFVNSLPGVPCSPLLTDVEKVLRKDT